MSSKHLTWLYRQLPDLVGKGIITGEISTRIQEHFGDPGTSSGKKTAIILFGVLGGLLVGGGVILLFAYNWAALSRPLRAILSFTPLVVCQLLGGWVLARQPRSVAWREGVGVTLMLSIGACIALISQTYHMPGSFDQFVLVWMLLSLPVIYLLRATTPAVLYLIGITAWAGNMQFIARHALGYYPLLALVLPHVWLVHRERISGGAAALLQWVLAVTVGTAIGITLEKSLPGLWIPIYVSFFTVLYLAGRFWTEEGASFWQRAFEIIGGGGIAILSLVLTYKEPWHSVGWRYYRYGWGYHQVASMYDYVLLAVLLLGAVVLLAMTVRHRHPFEIAWGAAPVVAVMSYGIASVNSDYLIPAMLFNVFLFALGLTTLIQGITTDRLGRVNTGMLVLAGVITARFFDGEFSILVRGLVFIALGTGFLLTNLFMLRRKGGAS